MDTLTIGRSLSAFPEHHAAAGTAPLEYGYGWFSRARGWPVLSDRALLDAVSKDVQRSLADSRDALAASVDRHRELHLARLERLLAGSWARAVRGDHQAVASCLRILDREARLLGLRHRAARPAERGGRGGDDRRRDGRPRRDPAGDQSPPPRRASGGDRAVNRLGLVAAAIEAHEVFRVHSASPRSTPGTPPP